MVDTYVQPNAGENFVILIGNGASPEVFSAPASINTTRGLKMSTAEKAVEIPDVTNPSNPAYTARAITAVDWQLDGAGIVNTGDDVTWATWWLTGAKKNVQIANSVTGGVVLQGPAVLTDCNLSGDRGDKVMGTITLKGAGLPAVSPHA